MTAPPKLCPHRRRVEELSDRQIQELMDFGKREAEIIDRLEAAVREGNRELAWEISEELVAVEDEAGKI